MWVMNDLDEDDKLLWKKLDWTKRYSFKIKTIPYSGISNPYPVYIHDYSICRGNIYLNFSILNSSSLYCLVIRDEKYYLWKVLYTNSN